MSIAECTGPHGAFRTIVHSSHTGLVRFEQIHPGAGPVLLGVDAEGPWVWDERRGAAVPGSPLHVAVIRGHEYHALAPWPESRLAAAESREPVLEGGRRLERRVHRDALGQRFALTVEPGSGRLRGTVLSPDPLAPSRDIVTNFPGAGRGRGDLPRAVITQAGERWEHRFVRVAFDSVVADGFERPEPRSDRDQILALHEAALRAHRSGVPEELLAAEADTFTHVVDGRVSSPSRAERRARFEAVQRESRFARLDDVMPPVVHLSGDAGTAWLVARVRAEMEARITGGAQSRPSATTSAWIELYEKRGGLWWRTGQSASSARVGP